MNFRLILLLSVCGIFMGFATVSMIPEEVEKLVWLVIMLFNACAIVKLRTGHYFTHGLLVTLANCLWVTIIHIIYYKDYNLNHPTMAALGSDNEYFSHHARHLMLVMSPVFGILFGIPQGVLTLVISKFVKQRKKKTQPSMELAG